MSIYNGLRVVLGSAKNDKAFGKLTLSQFQGLASSLPEVRKGAVDLAQALSDKRGELDRIIGPDGISWGYIYELPYLKQMAVLFECLGIQNEIKAVSEEADPQQAIIDWIGDGGGFERWWQENKNDESKKRLIVLVHVLQRNILSIMMFHKSLGGLVDDVRDGDDLALFNAVRVDRSVLLAAPCANRLSRAELVNDKTFFQHLRSAFKGPQQKFMTAIQDVRYSIVALRECGFDRFSDADIERLLISTKLYPNSSGALKNLRKHIQLSRKIQPPETRNYVATAQ